MAYEAIVTQIKVTPHPDKAVKRIAVGDAYGYNVIVGIDTQDGAMGVVFPPDGCLSHLMTHNNNLYRSGHGENKDITVSGYFEASRKIRVQKFKGVNSEGIWLPIESLAWTGADLSKLKVGDAFNELNGITLCEKFYSKATLQAIGEAKKKNKPFQHRTSKMFKEHYSTESLKKSIGRIPVGARIILTEKLHGTSGRSSVCQVSTIKNKTPLYVSLWNKAVARFRKLDSKKLLNDLIKFADVRKYDIETITWENLLGTRRTVKFENSSVNYRDKHHNSITGLKKGETIYYEIVGFEDSGKTIMTSCNMPDKSDLFKALRKQYDNIMRFSYGCEVSESKIYVYRMTMTNEDGFSVEYSWDQVIARCKDLNLNTVPFISSFILADDVKLIDIVEPLTSGPSLLDDKHIREGVCVRVEHPELNKVFKLKSFDFTAIEDYLRGDESFIDAEDVS